jgi:hypothetical protein
VDDEVYRRARVWAAQASTSVSAIVRQVLEEVSRKETTREQHQRELMDIIARIRAAVPDFDARDRLSRDDLHDRDALR